MKTFKQFITEAKQVGTLYHYTSPENASRILLRNTIRTGNNGYVSMTRNKDFHRDSYENNRSEVRTHVSFELDGDKISHKHKIKPHLDPDIAYFPTSKHFRKENEANTDESEERTGNDIENVHNYIKKIRIHDPNHPSIENVRKIAAQRGIPVVDVHKK